MQWREFYGRMRALNKVIYKRCRFLRDVRESRRIYKKKRKAEKSCSSNSDNYYIRVLRKEQKTLSLLYGSLSLFSSTLLPHRLVHRAAYGRRAPIRVRLYTYTRSVSRGHVPPDGKSRWQMRKDKHEGNEEWFSQATIM